jgi:cytochrome b subunit of formate dehydrogenase
MPTLDDVREFFHQIGYYLGIKRHEADFGRFSYAEKLEYLALVWGTIIMVATGFVLWFKQFFTAFLPGWGFKAAEMVHFYEAVLAFTTIIIWHLYMVFVHTDKPPFNPTWITGRMTRKTLEHHHPRALEDIEGEKGQEEDGEEDPTS